jgi:hypothetical protein
MDSNTNLSDEFIENIKQWLMLDDKVREISKSLKELKQMKKALHEKLLISMEKNEVSELKAGNGKLRYSVSKTKEPLKYESIEEGLLKYFDDDAQKVTEIWDSISNNRKVVERKRIKRTFNKKKE